ncbi:MAG: SCP2 sterol-binding domain-containing protein [Saprospiraceae bacterium]
MTSSKEFFESISSKVNPAAIEGLNTNLQFEVDEKQYTVAIVDGKLNVFESLEGTPKSKVKISEQNLVSLLNGNLNPMMAVFTGKLKIDNQGELLKYAKILGLM